MQNFLTAFAETFRAGGILMAPLAVLAFYLYFSGIGLCARLAKIKRICDSDGLFRSAFEDLSGRRNLARDAKAKFSRLRMELMAGVDRRIMFLKILSSVAPLIGLLGTVSGMCASIASAGDDPQGVADGISVALITTQAGLVVAIPSWIIAICASALSAKILAVLSRRESVMIREEASA